MIRSPGLNNRAAQTESLATMKSSEASSNSSLVESGFANAIIVSRPNGLDSVSGHGIVRLETLDFEPIFLFFSASEFLSSVVETNTTVQKPPFPPSV